MRDVIIIGAGPVGLACGIEAQRRGLDALIIEKGALCNSLIGYPTGVEFFSTPGLMEIGGDPLPPEPLQAAPRGRAGLLPPRRRS